MTLFIKAISDIGELCKIEEVWNAFASNHCDNPYILCKFIEMSMKSNPQGWTPLFLIGYANDEVVGIAPLMIRKKFGTRIATFALPPYSSPDFVIEHQFQTKFIDRMLDYLFQTLKCKVADLTFPAEGNNLPILQELCRVKGIYFGTEPYMGRRVLPVGCNWEQFESLKGGNFRRRFRKMENKLSRAGSYKISCVEKEEEAPDAFNKVLEIDKLSWKESWRSKKGEKTDPDLLITWEGAGCTSRTVPGFKRTVWLLELNGSPIAYAIILLHRQTATITKTSYDARYRNFYPGMYLINSALRTLFNSMSISNVDFMTDMSFMEAWTDICRSRIRVLIGRGILPTAIVSLYKDPRMRKTLNRIANKSPIRVGRLFG